MSDMPEVSVEVEVTEDVLAENDPNPMVDMVRKVLLASIGAVALTQEEVEKVVNKLIERGEIAEKDGRKLINDTGCGSADHRHRGISGRDRRRVPKAHGGCVGPDEYR